MGKCKNEECGLETKGSNIYCSFRCRNIYTNKYLRDYSKIALIKLEKSKRKEELEVNIYKQNVKYCKECALELNFKQRKKKFCSVSCGAKFNNKTLNRKENVFSDKGLENIRKSNKNKIKVLNLTNSICLCCKKEWYDHRKLYKYCGQKCRKEYLRKDKTIKQIYYKDAQFKFSLNKFPDEFDFELLKEYGMYKAKNKGDNPNGINRDHLYTIADGFKNNVDPLLLAHPANCKLITHAENVLKQGKSTITIDELILKIIN